jgi:hypothetical protein
MVSDLDAVKEPDALIQEYQSTYARLICALVDRLIEGSLNGQSTLIMGEDAATDNMTGYILGLANTYKAGSFDYDAQYEVWPSYLVSGVLVLVGLVWFFALLRTKSEDEYPF